MDTNKFINDVMLAAAKIQIKHGLPAATIVAQACLETGYGKYVLSQGNKYSYNIFNIKGTGTNGSVSVVAWEIVNGKKVDVKSNFRAYNNYEESFEDYTKLITGASRYKQALQVKHDPDKYAYAILACGYATDPDYAKKLISIMNQYKLRELAVDIIKKEANAVFKDVLDHWAKYDIEWLEKEGLIGGDLQGNFNPDNPATRAEMAVMMKRTIDYIHKKMGVA
ncbi:glucosaminidase domain-containing protein [Desulfotomaculum sp. 1211_IL3151]|uniref:glucosaminidase domain-containing protein n=1 Tax=Desulfotomaculum sp. 1211_IL3151 TaxID=3084055 RepID=UPI002FD96595